MACFHKMCENVAISHGYKEGKCIKFVFNMKQYYRILNIQSCLNEIKCTKYMDILCETERNWVF